MSALFFKVSWPHNIEKYRSLQKAAKKRGFSLVVKNMSRMRGIPIFLFYLDRKDKSWPTSFSDLDEVADALSGRTRRMTDLTPSEHEHSEAVVVAAQWLADRRLDVPSQNTQPLITTIASRFGLTDADAAEAILLAGNFSIVRRAFA